MRAAIRPLLASGAVAATLLLGGCAATVALQPAADAVNPICAQVIVALPETVAALEQRQTDAQGTSAWGDPASVILRCGVEVPQPTAEFPCYTVEGVDWLLDDRDAPVYLFRSYGRDPAVEVIVDSDAASARAALTDLAFAITNSPKDGECVAAVDTLQ
jgi:hypothetical protein